MYLALSMQMLFSRPAADVWDGDADEIRAKLSELQAEIHKAEVRHDPFHAHGLLGKVWQAHSELKMAQSTVTRQDY